jgi:competence protein ComEA
MRRQSQEEAAEAARRRLELLGRELDQAGLRRVDDVDERRDSPNEDLALPEPSRVAPAGRHARTSRAGGTRRLGSWVGDQVPDTLRGRVGLDPGPVLLVVALVALAVVATVLVVLRTGGESEAVPDRPAFAKPVHESPLVPSPGAPGPSTAGGEEVTVDVAGKVRRPGLTTLPAGSRVADALEKAGGPRGRVDLSALNLARVLVDGEQILVGRAAPPGGIAAGASTAAPDPTGALVNLNTATIEQLETLPGVGPVTAQKILDWRGANGAFSSVDELLDIDGIGDKTLAEIAPHATL